MGTSLNDLSFQLPSSETAHARKSTVSSPFVVAAGSVVLGASGAVPHPTSTRAAAPAVARLASTRLVLSAVTSVSSHEWPSQTAGYQSEDYSAPQGVSTSRRKDEGIVIIQRHSGSQVSSYLRERKKKLFKFLWIGGLSILRVGEALLDCVRDDEESCPVERLRYGRQLLYDVAAVRLLLDRFNNGRELPLRATESVHDLFLSFRVARCKVHVVPHYLSNQDLHYTLGGITNPGRYRASTPMSASTSSSTQPMARSTALFQTRIRRARSDADIRGENLRPSRQFPATSAVSFHTPAPRPAAYAAPSAVVSSTFGRTTSMPSTSAWNCMRKSLTAAPPSTRISSSAAPRSAAAASITS